MSETTLRAVITADDTQYQAAMRRITQATQQAARAMESSGKGGAASQAAGLTKAEQAAQKAATQIARLALTEQRLTQAHANSTAAANRAALAQQRLATEAARTEAAQTRAAAAALRFAQAQQQASQPPRAGLREYFDGLKTEITGTATAMIGLSAALGAAQAVGQSFAQAFAFKTELDATNASVAIQLRGVRDSAQVFAEAQAYGERYKLTQQQITDTMAASVGIFRSSTASVEQTFGVLQRLTVLAPGKTIQDAAFSVRELASGDITSIAEQFNISRQKAYEMRDAINGGADVVQVLAAYLEGAGVGMDTLAIRTEGAAGKMRELAVAQEQLQIAQAELASGPGLVFLQMQTEATVGLTRVLSGDFSTAIAAVEQRFAAYNDEMQITAALLRGDLTGAILDATDGFSQGSTAAGDWGQELSGAQQIVNAGIPPYIAFRQQAIQADQQAAAAAIELDASLQAQAAQALIAAANNELLTIKKTELEQQARTAADAVIVSGANIETEAARLAASSSLVDQLTAAFLRLAMANGQAASAGNQTGGREPSRRGIGDVNAVMQQIVGVQVKGEAKRTAVARSGGAARVSEESRAGEQLAQIAQQTADRLAEIDRRAAEQRAEAYRQLASSILTSSADMVASQEANDLELAGLNEQELERYRAREQAERDARARQAQIVQEAQQRAASGDAELAQKIYDIQSQANQDRQALDEEYNRRQAELAGNPEALAELQQQYNEAVAAQEQAAAIRIQLAEEAAAQAKAKAAEERAAVIADAEAQAAGVKGASDAQRATVVANLSAQQQAAMAWAGAMEAAASRVQAAASRAAGAISNIPSPPTGGSSGTSTGGSGGGAGGGTRAAGGGTFVTRGPTNLTVGDNPGGVELVTVTPLSGKGRTTVGGGMIRMAGGGAILADNSATNPALRDRPAKKERDLARQRETDARRALAAMDKERAEKEKNLLLDIERERQRRTLKRVLDAQEDAIDQRERAARKSAERQLDAQEEAQAAELARREKARRTGAVDQQEQAEQLRARQAYEAEAQRIIEQTGQQATNAQQFWARAQLADLQASFQVQQATIRESYAQQREQAVEGVESWAKEQLAAEFDARRELLQSTIEAAYQPERDALDDLSRYRLGMLDYELSQLKQASFSAGSLGTNGGGVGQLGPAPIPSGGGGFFAAPPGGGSSGDTILQMGPISIPAGAGVTAAQVEQIVRRVFGELMRQTGTSLLGR